MWEKENLDADGLDQMGPKSKSVLCIRAGTYQAHWLYQHIEAETKWTPFRRRHVQVHFLEWKYLNFEISLKFIAKGSINNNPALFQIMAWRRPGDKPLSEPMMARLLTHICVIRPQWVNSLTCLNVESSI